MPEDSLDERLRRLEEKASFLDREIEHLRDQVQGLWKELNGLEHKVVRIAVRLEGAQESNPALRRDDITGSP